MNEPEKSKRGRSSVVGTMLMTGFVALILYGQMCESGKQERAQQVETFRPVLELHGKLPRQFELTVVAEFNAREDWACRTLGLEFMLNTPRQFAKAQASVKSGPDGTFRTGVTVQPPGDREVCQPVLHRLKLAVTAPGLDQALAYAEFGGTEREQRIVSHCTASNDAVSCGESPQYVGLARADHVSLQVDVIDSASSADAAAEEAPADAAP